MNNDDRGMFGIEVDAWEAATTAGQSAMETLDRVTQDSWVTNELAMCQDKAQGSRNAIFHLDSAIGKANFALRAAIVRDAIGDHLRAGIAAAQAQIDKLEGNS
jgi:hypothetical protein